MTRPVLPLALLLVLLLWAGSAPAAFSGAGLLAYLPFDADVNDASGNGTLVTAAGGYEIAATYDVVSDKELYGLGAAYSASGMLGGNFFHSTGGSSVQLPTLTLGASTFSYTGWFAAHPNKSGGPFLGNANGGKGWYTRGYDNGGLQSIVNDGASNVAVAGHNPAGSNSGYWNWPPLANGGEYDTYWYFLAGSFDFTAGTIDLYVGATRSVLQAPGTRPAANATLAHQQFTFDPGSQDFLSGNGVMAGFHDNWPYAYANRVNLDDLSFWARSLTDEEIMQLWNSGNGTPLSALLGTTPHPSHPGDANRDGLVNLEDFGLLKDNFGATTGANWAMGDFNADGAINLEDFGILKDHFGHTSGDSTLTAIPEPATCLLLSLAASGVLIRRR